MSYKQVPLNAKYCSGRGVRIRVFSPAERRQIFETAAQGIGPEGTNADLRAAEQLDGICGMVIAVTEKIGFKSKAELLEPDVVWKPMTLASMTDQHTALLNAKDMAALSGIFHALHDVRETEIDDIMGEALDVTED